VATVVSRRARAAAIADEEAACVGEAAGVGEPAGVGEAAGVDGGAGAGVRGDLRKPDSALSIPLAERWAGDDAGGSRDGGCDGLCRTGSIGEAVSAIKGLAVGEK